MSAATAYGVLFWVTLVILLTMIGISVYAILKVESDLKTGFSQGCNANYAWAKANPSVANYWSKGFSMPTAFDPNLALACIYCNAMTAGLQCQSNLVTPAGMSLVTSLQTMGETMGTVLSGTVEVEGTNATVMIVSWRGTETLKDVQVDANEKLVNYPAPNSGQVHAGFLKAYQGARNQLLSVIESMKPEYVFVTGHSLGAAIATLAAYDLALSKLVPAQNIVVVPVASPKVGNVAFAEAYQSQPIANQTFIVCNAFDFVPTLPFVTSYVHVLQPHSFALEAAWTQYGNESNGNHLMPVYAQAMIENIAGKCDVAALTCTNESVAAYAGGGARRPRTNRLAKVMRRIAF